MSEDERKGHVILFLSCMICGHEWEKRIDVGSGIYEPECPLSRKKFVSIGSAQG